MLHFEIYRRGVRWRWQLRNPVEDAKKNLYYTSSKERFDCPELAERAAREWAGRVAPNKEVFFQITFHRTKIYQKGIPHVRVQSFEH